MKTDLPDWQIMHMPLADLERALIETFVRARGGDAAALAAMSNAAREALLREASLFASVKLAEIEARSHYLDELHE